MGMLAHQDHFGREAPWFHHRGRVERDVLCKSGPELWPYMDVSQPDFRVGRIP